MTTIFIQKKAKAVFGVGSLDSGLRIFVSRDGSKATEVFLCRVQNDHFKHTYRARQPSEILPTFLAPPLPVSTSAQTNNPPSPLMCIITSARDLIGCARWIERDYERDYQAGLPAGLSCFVGALASGLSQSQWSAGTGNAPGSFSRREKRSFWDNGVGGALSIIPSRKADCDVG